MVQRRTQWNNANACRMGALRDRNQRDITRTFLAVLFLGALIGTSLWILPTILGSCNLGHYDRDREPVVDDLLPASALNRPIALRVAVMTVVLLLRPGPCLSGWPSAPLCRISEQIGAWANRCLPRGSGPPPAWLAGLPSSVATGRCME